MPTRTIFFHISAGGQAVFYLLAAISTAVCFWGCYRRARLWGHGKPIPPVAHWPSRIKSLGAQMFAHRRVRRRPYAGTLHIGIFFGMLVLFIGTNIVAIEHYGRLLIFHHVWLYQGAFYLACKLFLDLAGLILLIGTGMALARRYLARPPNLGQNWQDGAFLLLLFSATLTGYLLEGAGLAADPRRTPYMDFSPIGSLFASALHQVSPLEYAILWWVHMPFVLGVIAALPYGRWLHLFVIPPTILLQPDRSMGVLEPVSMAQVEETGRIGLGQVADMTKWELMSLDGCMECGRCTDACPAHTVGKELDPKGVVLDLRKLLIPSQARPLPHGAEAVEWPSTDVISDASLWACTNCHACVRECPALIRHVDLIDGIRRYRVAEGRLAGTAATMLRQLGSREDPWGLPASQRLDWARGLEIPAASSEDSREILLWVGCAGAFDPRAQKTLRALAQLLRQAGVIFSILGPKERCTGDPARRTGDEFLYQQLAEANVTTLNEIGAQRIITTCPHCFHTLKNEYPQFGGSYSVQHHTQFLQQLVDEERIKLSKNFSETVTYHDPCFLARVNGVTEAPRRLLQNAVTIPVQEAQRRESKTFCCGAGGGRMWMEEDRSQRPGVNRAQELIATGAKTVATGCPFCKIMLGDSLAQVAGDNAPPLMDVAEVMLAAVTNVQPSTIQIPQQDLQDKSQD